IPSNSVPHTGHVFVYTRRNDASRLAAAERSSCISRGKTALAVYELPQSSTRCSCRRTKFESRLDILRDSFILRATLRRVDSAISYTRGGGESWLLLLAHLVAKRLRR